MGTPSRCQRRVVVVDPVPRLFGVEEREAERADAVLRREMDRLAPAARDPDRRMRPLAAAWARRCAAASRTCSPAWPVNGVSVRQRSATRSPSSHMARLSAGSMPKPPSSASDDDSPVPNSTRPPESDVERRDPLRDPSRVVERRRRLHDPVPEPYPLRALRQPRRGTPRGRSSGCTPRGSGARRARTSRSRSGRRARPARAPPRSTRALVAVVPGPWHLVLVEDPEPHDRESRIVGACAILADDAGCSGEPRSRADPGRRGVRPRRRRRGGRPPVGRGPRVHRRRRPVPGRDGVRAARRRARQRAWAT